MPQTKQAPQMQLRLARVALGMNQAKFSKLIGIGPWTLSRIETGETLPTLAQAVRIQTKTGIMPKEWIDSVKSAVAA